MADRAQRLNIDDLRGGRNGVDPPQSLSDHVCQEAVNVDFWNAPLGRRRGGVAAVTLTNSPFTCRMSSTFRHVPGISEAQAELWATDDAATPNLGRLVGGTAWATPTLKDAPTGKGWDFTYASLNGFLFIAYQSAVDRLHVWDPVNNIVRRTGLAVMTVPVPSDTGGGTYAATKRWYQTRATEQQSGVTVRRSEASTSAPWTPSGSGTGVVVTKGTAPGEGETHWEVEASTDGVTFYRIATVVIGTATYTDTADPTTYANNPVSATAGVYTLQTSYKFLAADQGRILGFGNFTNTNPQSRLVFSAVLGSSDIGDAERVPIGNFYGLDEKDSGLATAIIGPVNGSFFLTKYRQFWKATPTGDVANPYNLLQLHPSVGAVGPHAITVGEDESGRAAIYFTSYRGPYRWGMLGVEYIGKPVEDQTIGANDGVAIKLDASAVVSHVCWYPDVRQVWFWIAQGLHSDTDPDLLLIYTLGRMPMSYYLDQSGNTPSAWSLGTGMVAQARCSTLFSHGIGASMSVQLRPYLGLTTAVNTLGQANTGTQDLGTNFQATVTTKVYHPWGDGFLGTIAGAMLTAKAKPGVSIAMTTVKDFGVSLPVDTVDLTPDGTETRVQPRFGSALQESSMESVHFIYGDAAPVNASWAIDDLSVTWTHAGPVVA